MYKFIFSILIVVCKLTSITNSSFEENLHHKSNQNKTILLYIADIHFDAIWSDKAIVENKTYSRIGSQCKEFKIGENEQFDFEKYVEEKRKADKQDTKDMSQLTWIKTDKPKNIGYLGQCNTNINLLNEVLKKASEVTNSNPSKIFILGDSVNHNLYVDQKNVDENYTFTFEQLQINLDKYFNGIDRCFVMGNNDLVQRYKNPNKESYNNQIKRIEKYLMPNGSYFSKNIPQGYEGWINTWYSVEVNDHIVGLVINSILYNPANNYNEDAIKLRQIQLDYIEKELKNAGNNRKKAIINDHIQTFKHLYSGYEMGWDEIWAEKFGNLMKKYKNTILIIFSAHLHFGNMAAAPEVNKRNLSKGKINIKRAFMPTIHIPGISPINSSGTGFSIVELNGAELSNVTNYYFDLEKASKDEFKIYDKYWRKFDLKQQFKMNDFSAISIFNAFMDKRNERVLLEFYSGFEIGQMSVDEMASLAQVKLDESTLIHGKNDPKHILKYKQCAQMIYLQNQVERICNNVLNDDLRIVKKQLFLN